MWLRTWAVAKYVIVFITFPAADSPAARGLEWYRLRWQVEVIYKRFKSMLRLGYLANLDDDSAGAWSVREAARGLAGRENDPQRAGVFPLWIPLGANAARAVSGVTSISSRTKSNA